MAFLDWVLIRDLIKPVSLDQYSGSLILRITKWSMLLPDSWPPLCINYDVEIKIMIDRPNTILGPSQRLGPKAWRKEGRKIFIRTPADEISVPCWYFLKGFAGVVKSLSSNRCSVNLPVLSRAKIMHNEGEDNGLLWQLGKNLIIFPGRHPKWQNKDHWFTPLI